MAGKQLDRGNLVHRFSQCPSLSKELQQALRSYEHSMIAGLQELGETELPSDFGFSEDFNVETDGWGDCQVDGQDELSEPPATIIHLPEQLSKVRNSRMGTLSPEGAASPRQGFPAW